MNARPAASGRRDRAPAALRYRLAGLVAVVAIADFAFGAVNVVHMTEAGLSPGTIGAVLAVAGVASTLVEAPSGALGDLYGQRRMLVVGLLLWGTGQVIFGLSDSVVMITVALVLWAVGMACYSGAPFALVVNALRRHGREDLVGATVRRTQVTRWSASAVGALLVFLFADSLDPGVVVATAGALLLFLALWVRTSWEESPAQGGGRVLDTLRDGVRLLPRPEFRSVTLFTALGGAAFAVVVMAWQPLAIEAGLRASSLGAVLIVFTVASAVGAACSRIGERRSAVTLTVALLGLSALLVVALSGPVPALVALLVAEFLLGFMMAVSGVWSHEVFPDALRNTMLSLMGVVAGLTMAAVDAVFGLLWGAVGVTSATALCGAVLFLLVAAGFVVMRYVWREPGVSSVPTLLAGDVEVGPGDSTGSGRGHR